MRKKLVFMMPAFELAFVLLGDNIVEFSTENKHLKTKIGSYHVKW